jgi:hypothetical protein
LRSGTNCHARARTRATSARHLRRCAATAPEGATTHLRSSAAHAWGSASAAALEATAAARPSGGRSLRETHAWRDHRQNQRHHCRGTQNLQTDHHWLHLRDIAQPLERTDVPEPAHRSCAPLKLSGRNCMRNEQIAMIPRQCAAAVGGAQVRPRSKASACSGRAAIAAFIWTFRPADGIRAVRPLQPPESP